MAIDLEKLLNYLQRKTADTHELQAAKTILELIERLEAAEKQRDELLSAVELYEEALKASWPSGAEYDAFEYWNNARKAIASVKEQEK